MSASRKLIDALNQFSKNNFWSNPPNNPTFKEVLEQYAKYSASLEANELKSLYNAFWDQIKKIGTPIIEESFNDEANVYFLFRKDKRENNNDLYLQGEFHGYGGVSGRYKLDELTNTGIMYRIDSIPINAMITYQYQQLDAATINDDNSTHRNVYHHRYSGGSIFKVNSDPDQSHLGKQLGKNEEENYWNRTISSESNNSSKNFSYHTTLYSDSTNNLH